MKFRLRMTHISTGVSIMLVLYLTGALGLLIIQSNRIKRTVKEDVQFGIYYKEFARESDILKQKKRLESRAFVKQARYITKDSALHIMLGMGRENPEELIGFNPLKRSVELTFKAEYATPDSMRAVKAELEQADIVQEVYYDKFLIENIDNNVRLAATFILTLAVFFGLIAVTLINNTIRLSLYSRRLIIKSMQLVGATERFIVKPFALEMGSIGSVAGILACSLLAMTVSLINDANPELKFFELTVGNYFQVIFLMIALLALGIMISGLSSIFAVRKFLRTRSENLI